MIHSNKLVELLLLFAILKTSAPALNLPNTLPLLLELVEDNLYDVLNYDEPLFLSPYIESGEIETRRSLSRVGQLPNAPPSVPSYSGFFTVNKEYNSNLFFWFFPALNHDVTALFILWLEGGPGGSGLSWLFVLHGPYVLYSNTTAGLRNHTWAKEFHVLYVDNPVGTGFSFTDNNKGYSTTLDQVTDNLYVFLRQFFEIFYEYRHNDLYICAESYGGKYGPYLAYKMHIDGPPAEIILKGIAVGNGFVDIHILKDYDKFLFQLGIVDSKQASIIKDTFVLMEQHLQNGEYSQVVRDLIKLHTIPKKGSPTTSYLTTFSGYEYGYDFLQTKKPEDLHYFREYIQTPHAGQKSNTCWKPSLPRCEKSQAPLKGGQSRIVVQR